MTEFVQVTVAIDDRAAAGGLSRAAVEARLAACGQVLGPVTSTYRWRGAVETAEEWLLVCKTTAELYPALEAFLRERHPYDTPEILATPVFAGAPDYLSWVRAETGASAGQG